MFSNNCFYGTFENIPDDANAIFSDPMFVNVSSVGDGFDVLKNFMLKRSSPLMGKGKIIPNYGGKDIFGIEIKTPPNIGAFESN